ncbi:MarR family transcriptional regulator [Saccharibacillus sp. CPCC 101409]|uniref:MarR family winged helix-turn-helix transcriptional regulator n=1 Tax=Saccharibacillus sp. CPCC 101409 TaxID=3058041 RepID=UPI0026738F61|nr:MarR family transcriptional regulator [Saccharibacillus sp. CPCC 101409]MDO3410758.1 MarR family transcriptional regulator [Saccharibacillus sp. CPCC 101409]
MDGSIRMTGDLPPEDAKRLINRFLESWLAIEREMGTVVRRQMQEDLTNDQYYLLQKIMQSGPCTSSELAETFKVVKSSITAIVTRLVDRGLIERTRSEEDRREVYLSLTERGHRIAEQVEQRISESVGSYLSHFEEKEIEMVMSAFERLARLVVEDGGRDKE